MAVRLTIAHGPARAVAWHTAGVMLALLLVRPASADVYVSAAGSDGNAGYTADKPLLTLQKADTLVHPGDTVWVMKGTYRNSPRQAGVRPADLLEIKTSGRPDAPVTWRNYKDDRPELIAQGCWNAIHVAASYVVIDGLTLTGNNDNVRQIDAEKNAEIDAVKTDAAFLVQGHDAKKIDETVAPDAKLSGKDLTNAVVARAKPVAAVGADPFFNGNGISVDCRKGPVYHHVTVRNCVIRKFGTGGISMIATDYYTLENNEVYENAWYSRYGGSGISQLEGRNVDRAPGYHNVIRGNRVWNNKCLVRCFNTDCFSDGNGIILDSLGDYSGDVLVENNVSFNNGGSGLHVFKSNAAHIDVVNNTFWRNQQMWQLFELGAHSAVNCRFLNNVVYAERRKQVTGKPLDTVTYDGNLYYGSDQILAKGPNDVVADPLFVMASTNPEVADFRLRPGSPALGSGTTQVVPKTDKLGIPRAAKPSRGAYEAAGVAK